MKLHSHLDVYRNYSFTCQDGRRTSTVIGCVSSKNLPNLILCHGAHSCSLSLQKLTKKARMRHSEVLFNVGKIEYS